MLAVKIVIRSPSLWLAVLGILCGLRLHRVKPKPSKIDFNRQPEQPA
jgi:hypothetical protein